MSQRILFVTGLACYFLSIPIAKNIIEKYSEQKNKDEIGINEEFRLTFKIIIIFIVLIIIGVVCVGIVDSLKKFLSEP